MLNLAELQSIELDGIDTSDYPDFCDVYIAYAEHKDGTPLSEAELEMLDQPPYNMVCDWLF